MIDLQAARDAAMRVHLSSAVLAFLAIAALAAELVAGYTLGLSTQRHLLATASFVVLTILLAFIILDIDRPRRGFFPTATGLLRDLGDTMRTGAP